MTMRSAFITLAISILTLLAACGSGHGSDTDPDAASDLDGRDGVADLGNDGDMDSTDVPEDADAMSDDAADAVEDGDLDARDIADPNRLRNTYRFTDEEAYPESVAWDPMDRAFYTGSLATGTVTRMDVDGTESEFFAGNPTGEWLVLGLKVDATRRRLWACADLGRDFQRGEVWVLDLDTGERIWRADLEDAGTGAACADVVIDANGNAFVCDRQAGRIYYLDLAARTVEEVVSDPLLEPGTVGQNGMAFTPEGTGLLTVKFAPLQLMHVSLEEPVTVSEVELIPESGPSISGGGDALVVYEGNAYIVTDSQLIQVVPDATAPDGPWSSANISVHVLETAAGDPLTGVSGLTVAEDAFYVSKSEVFKFALFLTPELPFLLQRVGFSVFE